ncbi:MAG TPA: glycoside hydrolase family 28 [Bacteroidetes bacterium]|nr:glycoside hydrolase family 28 [Bacteroidota bacterium]
MKSRGTVAVSIFLLFLFGSCLTAQQSVIEQEIKAYTSNLPFSMPVIQLPAIPDASVTITDFGAVADGRTMNTKSINDAIRTCANKGGGIVVIPPGMWLTGPIELASNIELRIETGAMVFFSPKFEDYPVPARGNKVTSPIHGRGLTNIAITGKGIFNGNGQYWRPVKKEKLTERQWRELIASGGVVTPDGKMWWPSKEAMNGEEYLKNLRKNKKNPTPEETAGAREFLRPTMLDLVGCNKVLIDGPTFTNTPGWALHPTQCENLVIRNTTVTNNWWGQNTDAADISACRNVLLYRNVFDVGDDGICMKSSAGSDPKREFALENVVIADCIVYHAHGGFVIGSNTDGGMRNISVKNCTFIGTDIGLRFKSARDRGGKVENIFVDGIRMKDIATAAILFDMFYESNADNDPGKVRIPYFRNFDIRNVVCDGAREALFVRGLTDAPIQSVTLTNLSVTSKQALKMENADGFTLTNVWLNFKSGPVLTVNNGKNIQLHDVTTAAKAELFVRAIGAGTTNVQVRKSDAAAAKQDVELAPEVKPGAVIVK